MAVSSASIRACGWRGGWLWATSMVSPGSFFCISTMARRRSRESFGSKWAQTAESKGSPITSTARGFSRPDRSSFGNLLVDPTRTLDPVDGVGHMRDRLAHCAYPACRRHARVACDLFERVGDAAERVGGTAQPVNPRIVARTQQHAAALAARLAGFFGRPSVR